MVLNMNGICACGCGQKTPIAARTRSDIGWIKGRHVKCMPGHSPGKHVRSAPPGFRRCPKCKLTKPLSDFHRCASGKEGRNSYCAECNRDQYTAWRLRNVTRQKRIALKSRLKKLGMTLHGYDAMLLAQGGVCAVCKQDKGRRMCVDHDHSSGKIRGILCTVCNLVLGLVRDNPDSLTALASYLERNR